MEAGLFFKGIRPAMNFGLSVSRVGSAAQNAAISKMASSLKLEMALYSEIEVFAQFDQELDAQTAFLLTSGSRLVELLKQVQFKPLPITHQLILMYSGMKGFLDKLLVKEVSSFVDRLLCYFNTLVKMHENPLKISLSVWNDFMKQETKDFPYFYSKNSLQDFNSLRFLDLLLVFDKKQFNLVSTTTVTNLLVKSSSDSLKSNLHSLLQGMAKSVK